MLIVYLRTTSIWAFVAEKGRLLFLLLAEGWKLLLIAIVTRFDSYIIRLFSFYVRTFERVRRARHARTKVIIKSVIICIQYKDSGQIKMAQAIYPPLPVVVTIVQHTLCPIGMPLTVF